MLHTRFKAESPVLRVGSCHGTQPKVTGLSALPRKANLDKPAACRAPTTSRRRFSLWIFFIDVPAQGIFDDVVCCVYEFSTVSENSLEISSLPDSATNWQTGFARVFCYSRLKRPDDRGDGPTYRVAKRFHS